MIGIIVAMTEERDAIVKLMNNVTLQHEKKLNYHGKVLDDEYYLGDINGKQVLVHHCGVGKVYAAMGTQMLIDRFHPELVINLGCAGSLNENVHAGDIVIATRTADWDFAVPGWERSITSEHISNACSSKCGEIAKELNWNNIHVGPIVSGDQFIMTKEQLAIIKEFFPDALAGEMEGNATATVCYSYGVPCCVIRSISDETLTGNNLQQYEFNLVEVCDEAGRLCRDIIERF